MGEQFGYEKIQAIIQYACDESYSAEETLDLIFQHANQFRGNAPQSDDMTCMVLRVEPAVII